MGKLQLCVVAARNLANPQRIGMPDPYVRVVVCNDGGGSSADGKATREQPHKTHVVDNTLSPTWNCTFVLRIADERSAQLRCEVWNRNVFDDDKMGSYSVSVANLTRGVVHDAWYTLVPPDTNGDDGGGATRTVVVGAEAQLRLRMLALDFGAAPSPAQAWMVTDDIAHDPVQRAIDDGTWRRGQTAPPPPSASHTIPATTITTTTTATATAAPPVTVVYAQAAAPPPPAVTTAPPAVVYASPPMYAAYAPPPQQPQQQPQQPYYAYNTATAWQPQPYAAGPLPPPAAAAVPAGYAAMPATAAYYAPPPPPPPQQPMTYMPATPTPYYTTATTPPPPTQPSSSPQPQQPYATQPGFRY